MHDNYFAMNLRTLRAFVSRYGGILVASVALNILAIIALGTLIEDDRGILTGLTQAQQPHEMITTTEAFAFQNAIIGIVDRSSPAVVSIIATREIPIYRQSFRSSTPFEDLFDYFGELPFPSPDSQETVQRQVSGGSGFFVSADGYIVTNAHVVDDTQAVYSVITLDGREHTASIVAADSTIDIAVLKIDGANLPYLQFADSDALKVGQSVIAIGNVLGEFQNSVSVGVVSGLSRSIIAQGGQGAPEQLDQVIQTDAAINPGNSGGPLLDLYGRVIGVNIAVAEGSENIGFALPANLITTAIQSAVETGEITRPFLGVRYTPITPAMQEKNDLPVSYGALVATGEGGEQAVIPESPAAVADIQAGDIILSVDGVRIEGTRTLASLVGSKHVGDEVSLEVVRSDGKTRAVTVTLEKAPEGL
jgi:serine protease Do